MLSLSTKLARATKPLLLPIPTKSMVNPSSSSPVVLRQAHMVAMAMLVDVEHLTQEVAAESLETAPAEVVVPLVDVANLPMCEPHIYNSDPQTSTFSPKIFQLDSVPYLDFDASSTKPRSCNLSPSSFHMHFIPASFYLLFGPKVQT